MSDPAAGHAQTGIQDSHPEQLRLFVVFLRWNYFGYVEWSDAITLWARVAFGSGPFTLHHVLSSRLTITDTTLSNANASELLGRGIAQGISTSYYPSSDRTFSALAVKYGYAIGRDAVTNASATLSRSGC